MAEGDAGSRLHSRILGFAYVISDRGMNSDSTLHSTIKAPPGMTCSALFRFMCGFGTSGIQACCQYVSGDGLKLKGFVVH